MKELNDTRDGFMSCPCGLGDYELCRKCPYPACSVHGSQEGSDEGGE